MPNGLIEDPMVFVSIDADGTVNLVAHRSEMGTGSRTTLPMIMADEMEADWDRVNIIQAEGDEPKYGNQNTNGSRSLRHHIQAARKIGGSVRTMLAQAAAEEWGVPVSEVVVSNHTISHAGKSLGFGDLAEKAMALPVPAHEDIDYKSEDEFRYMGKGQVQITDLRDITTGEAVYGADVTLPGMKVAMVARPPVVGGKATSFDADAAMAVPGVVGVHELPYSSLPGGFAPLGGVAVVADNTYAAILGREALNVTWEGGDHAVYNTETFMADMVAEAEKPGVVLREQGDPDGAFANAAKVFTRTYTQDHMAHIPMEPPVALANFTGDALEIWAPVQSPYQARQDAAKAVGLDEANVRVNVTLLGDGFGRKSKGDFVTEAALLSQMVKAPVRVQWTREDDVHHSYYHTASAERIEAALDDTGKVVGWRHNSTAPSILAIFAPDSGHQFPIENGMGHVDMPFDIPNVRMDNGKAMAHTRVGWFRAVSNVPRAWAIGSFVGELAAEQGKDQRTTWLDLIGSPRTVDPVAEGYPETFWNYGEPAEGFKIQTGKLINVLNIAADAAGYGKELPEGEGIGLAVHRSFVSYVAVAARVKIIDGKVTVPEMHMAIDCGYAANPERIKSQMEGASVMGMTVAQHSGITFKDGAVQQSNFYDYDVARSTNYPNNVQVHIVPHGFAEHSTGVGEPGVPPVSPAIANAIFEAQGKRLRHLPMGETI
ncbi:molybdopterin-dependent oxidoreductase [Sulfitobacter sp. JBTF-M27]|uniref:Molybdopterin-dependent oxidoreductase n=1 Tax=Sulfitobacter sediminilitoris TaxID=2698830 RepID=A0A6P0CKG2_9RHOB|nr:molybdopterin cofactor-binding domain-containing protein [Sulfitobacter sediminilitoris]NEK25023.1 molybdopterin-dependent oxidoreductase [Sulfitobacter sediminilitoris]